MPKYVHAMIKEVALNMARETFVQWARVNNAGYQEAKAQGQNEETYAEAKWPLFIPQARATLVQMLSGPYPEELKSQIAEVLILDKQFVRGAKTLH